MRIDRTLVLLSILAVSGCGGATIVLKSPVEDQCNKASLKGCPEVVEGVLVYVGGDKPRGKDEMLRGAAQNAPDRVKAFAQAIRTLPLDKIPGAQKYTSVILEVADILAGAQGAAGAPGAPSPDAAPVAGQPAPPGRGYELFFAGKRVSGPDAQFYTRDQAIKHCASMVQQHQDTQVTCSFDGTPFAATR